MTVSADEEKMTVSADEQKTMKRVVVDHFGGPEVLRVVEDDVPQPGPGEVRVRVLAAGVSFTDAQLRAGTYLGRAEAAVHARL
jgi:NADPH:quinone reductase-like Zn-dependent oxidoreductase